MTTTNNSTKGVLRLYSCGGAGINIGSRLEHHADADNPGYAKLDTCYIDTSSSNLNTNIPEDKTYLIRTTDGGGHVDGSGKFRAENYPHIVASIKNILLTFAPGTINVVVSSGAGGSGPVIATSLVYELIARGELVIGVVVGSSDTLIEINNTLKTIKSYEAVVRNHRVPVTIAYIHNTDKGRQDADEKVQLLIGALSALFSRQNAELDTKDLAHWLNYHKVTSYEPTLSALTVCTNDGDVTKLGNIISAATLAAPGVATRLPNVPEYQAVGFIPQVAGERTHAFAKQVPVHFVISDEIPAQTAKSLQDKIDAADQARDARIVRDRSILSAKDEVQSNGLVL